MRNLGKLRVESFEFAPWNLLFSSLETGNKNFQRTIVTHIRVCARHGEEESYLSYARKWTFWLFKKAMPITCMCFVFHRAIFCRSRSVERVKNKKLKQATVRIMFKQHMQRKRLQMCLLFVSWEKPVLTNKSVNNFKRKCQNGYNKGK